jgi:DnaJ-class molecular chaperone
MTAVLIVIAIVAAFGYYVSLRIHPFVKCWLCKGTGRHFGSIYQYSHRKCRKCGGSGRRDRLGTRFIR